MQSKYFLIATSIFIMNLNVSYAKQNPYPSNSLSNEKIKRAIIKESLEYYRGNCPCPYNLTKNGSRCGKRSAYSKPGGDTPLCYPRDVTIEMIEDYKKSNKLR